MVAGELALRAKYLLWKHETRVQTQDPHKYQAGMVTHL